MNPRKLLFVITKSNFGGAQRQVYELATYFAGKGYDIAVILGGKGVLAEKLTAANIRIHSIPNMGRDIKLIDEIGVFFRMFSIIKTENPHVLHVHSPKAAGIASLAGRLLGIKNIIYTVHGWAFNEDRSFYQKTLIAGFSWLTMLLSTKIVNISEKEREQTILFPGISNKTILIRNGLSAEAVYSQKNARMLLEKMGNVNLTKKICLGSIGELHPNKGQIYLLEALKELVPKYPELHLIIIGEGEERHKFEKFVEHHKLTQHVTFLGFVENAAHYLKGFDIFVFPSLKEGLPYAILEAGVAGIAVISTSVGGIPEIIDDMQSGVLIQPKRSKEIVSAIEFLIEHKKDMKEYAKNLHNKVLTEFNREKMLEQLEHLYQK